MHPDCPRSRFPAMQLIVRARRGDQHAWAELVRDHAAVIDACCRQFRIQSADRDDVSQEVWLSVSRHLHRFRPTDDSTAFRGWLSTIARRKCIDHCRRSARHRAIGGEAGQALCDAACARPRADFEPVSTQHQRIRAARVMRWIRQSFNETYAKIFAATALRGEPALQVASDLGVTVNTVYVAKSRIVARLRKIDV